MHLVRTYLHTTRAAVFSWWLRFTSHAEIINLVLSYYGGMEWHCWGRLEEVVCQNSQTAILFSFCLRERQLGTFAYSWHSGQPQNKSGLLVFSAVWRLGQRCDMFQVVPSLVCQPLPVTSTNFYCCWTTDHMKCELLITYHHHLHSHRNHYYTHKHKWKYDL